MTKEKIIQFHPDSNSSYNDFFCLTDKGNIYKRHIYFDKEMKAKVEWIKLGGLFEESPEDL